MSKETKDFYEFGPFRVDARRRVLLRDHTPLPLLPKAFDTLLVLVQNSGRVLEKDELMKLLWPNSFVEEANLAQNISVLRKALGEQPSEHRYIVTVPGRGYRFAAPVRHLPAQDGEVVLGGHSRSRVTIEVQEEQPGEQGHAGLPGTLPIAAQAELGAVLPRTAQVRPSRVRWRLFALAGGILAALVALLVGLKVPSWREHSTRVLTERDTVLLADFANTTGEAAFDGTLKEALAVQLEQSPFLNIFPEPGVRETLRYMGRSPDERVTGEIAREVCERQAIKAMLTGSITGVGNHYVIALQATNCRTGDSLAREQIETDSREHVLATLGKAATELRGKLGESLSSIQKFDVPLTQATTSSLEAFKAYTVGREQALQGKDLDAIPFYKRAIELDPNFASAYVGLNVAYSNQGEEYVAAGYARKAFELRDRVSEREKFALSSRYYRSVTGELDKASEVLEVWKRSYPRDFAPRNNLGIMYERMGEFEKAAEEYRAAISLSPQPALPYQNLARVLLYMDRPEEAKAVFQEAIAKKMESTNLHLWLYRFAHARGDAAAMQREVEWATGKPDEYRMVWEQSRAALFEGRLEKARELGRRASNLAQRRNLHEMPAFATAWLAEGAALMGKCRGIPEEMATMMAARLGRREIGAAMLAVGFCSSAGQAKALIEDVHKRFPMDTMVNAVDLSTASAANELNRGSPTRAIELLQSAAPYERPYPSTIYVRGLAYLSARKGAEAAAEFGKIAGLRGASPNSPTRALAHLGLGRAYTLIGDVAKSRRAYEDFLALWKDADPDIPILRQAQAEYAKLK